MRVALLRIEGCRIGLRVAEDVYNKNNAMIIPKDYVITERVLKVIRANAVERIKVYLEKDEKSEFEVFDDSEYSNQEALLKAIKEYKDKRVSSIIKVEEVFFDVSKGKPIKKSSLDEISTSLKQPFDTKLIPYINSLNVSDNYTLEHTMNVATLALIFAKWLNLDNQKADDFVRAALLHDIGRTKVNQNILGKPGKLTQNEYEQIKQHVVFSYRMIQDTDDLSKDVKLGVLMHHERNDGSGYPLGAKYAQIHEFGKMLAIIDTYDAMTTDRAYQSRMFALGVLDELYHSSFGKLEYAYVNVFITKMLTYYTGCTVRLNTGEIGSIVHIDVKNVTKPIIKIDCSLVDLKEELDLEIEEFI